MALTNLLGTAARQHTRELMQATVLRPSICVLPRRHIKMGVSPEPQPQLVSTNPKKGDSDDDTTGNGSSGRRSVISSITGDFSQMVFGKKIQDPQVDVVANGLGSLLHVKFPENSRLTVRPGSVLGRSVDVHSRVRMGGNPFQALLKRLAGTTFFMENLFTYANSGDAVIAPKDLGDVAVIPLSGTVEYCLNASAFLAATPAVNIGVKSARISKRFLGKGLLTLSATGTGSIAITGHGGLFRLVLGEDDEYVVSKSHLIAWNAAMDPVSETVERDAEVAATGATYAQRVWRFITSAFRSVTYTHENDMCRLHGPGDFFLSSRLHMRSLISKKSTYVLQEQQPQMLITTKDTDVQVSRLPQKDGESSKPTSS